MGEEWGRDAEGIDGPPSAPECLLALVAGGYAAAGVAVTPRPPGDGPALWFVDAVVTVGLAAVALAAAVVLWRSTRTRTGRWRVAGGYLGGLAAATTLLAVATAATGTVPALAPARPPLGPGVLRPGAGLLAAGNVGGVVGLLAGQRWADRTVRRRAPSLLLDDAPAAAWLFRPDASESLFVAPSYEPLFGQSTGTVEADPSAVVEAAHPEDRERLSAAMNRVADGETVELEFRPDADTAAGWVWLSGWPVRQDGEVVAVAGVAHDITDRRRHREQLASLHDATRRLFRAGTAAEAADIATEAAEAVLDLPVNTVWLYDGTADELVPAATTEAHDAGGRSLPMFRAGDSLAREAFDSGEPQVYDDVRSAPGGAEVVPTRSELVVPLGEFGVFMAGSTGSDQFDARQVSLAKVLAANVEVALARIERTDELRANRRELERRNERLDQFAGIVSHDLRNPLAVARGYTDLLAEETDSEHAATVDAALERMEALIEDLLTLAREGEAIDELEPVPLGDVARQSWGNVRTEEGGLVVEAEGVVRGDRDRLAQLFENLFRNSVEHGATDDGATVTVGTLPDGFYVEDDGPGIPPGERDQVFETGYSTAGDGTGLGLSIVRTVAEAHGWSVSVTAGADGGARFEATGVDIE
jgi:PAS domain S-box-containing protein